MSGISLKQIEAFVQVADLGSFRRAAEVLNTTQPNISTRIAGLEERLGVRLMERDAGSVRLTPMGQALLPKARAVLRGMDDFLMAAADDRLFEGVLRLGVTEMVVHSWLGDFLGAFRARFPNVEVDLTVDLSVHLSEALFRRRLDLALQSGPFNRQTSGGIDLGRFPLIWVAAPSLGFGDGVLSLAELAVHPVLTHTRGTLPFEQLRDHFAASPEVPTRLVPSSNVTACIQMAREGLGVACLPAIMLERDIAEGALRPLRYLWCPDALRFRARFDIESSAHFVAEAARLAGEISARHAA